MTSLPSPENDALCLLPPHLRRVVHYEHFSLTGWAWGAIYAATSDESPHVKQGLSVYDGFRDRSIRHTASDEEEYSLAHAWLQPSMKDPHLWPPLFLVAGSEMDAG